MLKTYLRLMRLNKPVGILLLLWPTLWALWLANHGWPSWHLLIIFVLGTIVTRSAGCIINDIADRDFDYQVARTAQRPLTSGQMTIKEALALLAILCLIALCLALMLNWQSFALAVLAAVIASIYPFTKRFIYYPQVILGMAYAMGVPIAYTASIARFTPDGALLYLIAVLWPLMYDTAYALTDYEDDLKAGIKSTAVLFGKASIALIALLQGIIIILLLILGWWQDLTWPYFLSLAISALLFWQQQRYLKHHEPFRAFLNNQWLGLIIFLGVVLGLL